MASIEEGCIALTLSFQKHWDSGGSYDADVTHFLAPDLFPGGFKRSEQASNHDGEGPVIDLSKVAKVLDDITELAGLRRDIKGWGMPIPPLTANAGFTEAVDALLASR